MEVIQWQLDLLDLVSQLCKEEILRVFRNDGRILTQLGRRGALHVVLLWANELVQKSLSPKGYWYDHVWLTCRLQTYFFSVCLILDWLCMGRHVVIHLKVFLKTTYIAKPRGGKRPRRVRPANFRVLKWKQLQAQHELCQHILSSRSDQHFFPSTDYANRKRQELESRNYDKEDSDSVLRRVLTEGFYLSRFHFSKGESIGQAVDRLVHGRLGVLARGILLTGESEEAECRRDVFVEKSRMESGHLPKFHRVFLSVNRVRSSLRQDQDASASPMPWRVWRRRKSVLATKATKAQESRKGRHSEY